jgi:hypothetical protein
MRDSLQVATHAGSPSYGLVVSIDRFIREMYGEYKIDL